jgi:hypothetical protein
MKKIILFSSIAMTVVFYACNKGTALPPYTASNIFSVYTSMTHAKDTIMSSGDTIKLTAQGNIFDTSRKYGISAYLKATASGNQISGESISSITLTFDTIGMSVSHLYHWTSLMNFPIPAVPTKTVITSTATFTYGLSLSSQTGNQIATDSKTTYAK